MFIDLRGLTHRSSSRCVDQKVEDGLSWPGRIAVERWLTFFLKLRDLVRLATQPKSSGQEASRQSVRRNNPH